MNAIRCPGCGKKLAEGRYVSVLIKCPRCRLFGAATKPPLIFAFTAVQYGAKDYLYLAA